MENIPLRAYNREIEQLIDNSRSQDALLHCQQILDFYPRCLDTFRLIGKAYLELHQYEEAEETFQKVLSSIPDDFTANLGMSLLREKQNNVKGTIWHMERAYEAQPSNTAVQSELRRLYQQRDGVESSRIRLTRGALVRMYIRGDLIPQALNEIQAILQEDPTRIDIRVLQAAAQLKAGKKDEAFQNCRQILQELPYCYEANRILFENIPASTRIDEAQDYQKRLRELDPYYEYTSTTNPDPGKVPEDVVKISIPDGSSILSTAGTRGVSRPLSAFETFTKIPPISSSVISSIENKPLEPDQPNALNEEKPAWLEGIEIASFHTETSNIQPDVLSDSSSTPKKEFESSEPMTSENPSLNAELPINKDTPADDPLKSSLQANPFLTSTGDQIPVAEPGEIPEWLRALASEPPAASSDAITAPLRVPGETGVLQTGEENLDFLRNLPGEPQPATPLPPERSEIKQKLSDESMPSVLPADPFLVTSESTQPIPLEEGSPETTAPSREMPDWLRTAADNIIVPAASTDFRQEFTPMAPQESGKETSFSVDENQLPTEQQSLEQPESKVEEEIPSPELEKYLEQLRKDISPGEQPEWLQKENLGSEIEALFDKDKKPIVQSSVPEESQSWIDDLKKDDQELSKGSPSTSPISVPNVPDWLFTPETNEEDTAPIQLEPPITKQPTPDWLKDVTPEVFGRSESLESSEYGQEKPGEPEDQRLNLDFLQSQPVDFFKTDREPLEDNLDFSKAVPAENLPEDLAAIIREEAEKEIHTNPLQEEEPVSQTFTPSDFFTSPEFRSEQVFDEKPPESEPPIVQMEMPSNVEPLSEPEIALETAESVEVPSLDISQVKETGPVIPVEEISPMEPVAAFEEIQPLEQVAPAEEILPVMVEDFSRIDETKEQPIIQSVPEEETAAQFAPESQPFVQPIPEEKLAVLFVSEEKPAIKEKQPPRVPPQAKSIRIPEPQKPVRRLEQMKPVTQSIPRRSAGAADLTRAREAVSRGDLIAALRRYIKLVNANKSLDNVSSDLKDLVRKNPKNYLAWQTYGDARLRSNRIQEALDAYAKAADLLK